MHADPRKTTLRTKSAVIALRGDVTGLRHLRGTSLIVHDFEAAPADGQFEGVIALTLRIGLSTPPALSRLEHLPFF